MVRKHPKSDMYMADRDAGMTYREIAEKHGVSYQAVAQCCGRQGPYFKAYTEEEVVYPGLRKWLNENRVTRSEFIRRMGNIGSGTMVSRIGKHFRGENLPTKKTIDSFIEVTGMTYEQLFATEDRPQTNSEHVRRSLSDAELAALFHAGCPPKAQCRWDEGCQKCWQTWLQQPYEGGENDG